MTLGNILTIVLDPLPLNAKPAKWGEKRPEHEVFGYNPFQTDLIIDQRYRIKDYPAMVNAVFKEALKADFVVATKSDALLDAVRCLNLVRKHGPSLQRWGEIFGFRGKELHQVAEIRVSVIAYDGKNSRVDISDLNVASSNPTEASWGGLTTLANAMENIIRQWADITSTPKLRSIDMAKKKKKKKAATKAAPIARKKVAAKGKRKAKKKAGKKKAAGRPKKKKIGRPKGSKNKPKA